MWKLYAWEYILFDPTPLRSIIFQRSPLPAPSFHLSRPQRKYRYTKICVNWPLSQMCFGQRPRGSKYYFISLNLLFLFLSSIRTSTGFICQTAALFASTQLPVIGSFSNIPTQWSSYFGFCFFSRLENRRPRVISFWRCVLLGRNVCILNWINWSILAAFSLP